MADITPQDKGEYDYEGDMVKSQLKSIIANSKRLHDMLEDNTNLPEWVQSKVTLAEDYILTAANYMEGEVNEAYQVVAHTKTGEKFKSGVYKKKADAQSMHYKLAKSGKNKKVNLMKVAEETTNESVATAQKVADRATVVANTNPDPKKRFAAGGLANKAKLRTINPTGVNTGITRGGGNRTYRMITGKVPPYQLKSKTGVSEEEMKPYVKAAQKKFDMQGKAQEVGKKQAGTLAAKKERESSKQANFAQKAVDLAKGKKNRINKDPKVEVDVKV